VPEPGPGRGLYIETDASEEASGIPSLLRQAGACLSSKKLPAGDYLIEHRILVERKAPVHLARELIGITLPFSGRARQGGLDHARAERLRAEDERKRELSPASGVCISRACRRTGH